MTIAGIRPRLLTLLALCIQVSSSAYALESRDIPPASKAQGEIEKILSNYSFVGDFNVKEETRNISDEVFWRYPFQPPKTNFPILFEIQDPSTEMPATMGEGRAVDHLNRGRVLFLEKKYLEAKSTWLSARARYGKDYPYHRRTDYFIGMAFLLLAKNLMTEKSLPLDSVEVRSSLSNAATFFSWAFIMKADQPDALVDKMATKGLYNLAAIYWQYDRFAGAFGAADTGLNFLRKTGRKDFRPKFQRIVAESFVRNRTYLDAIQALDQSIRQDKIPEEAAASLGRAGDIYFDLNNYELAEDAYSLASKIHEHLKMLQPAHLALEGESLFWLGKFSESQKMFHFALNGSNYRTPVAPLPESYLPWISLRIADAYLARKEIDKARLEYYKVGHEFRSHPAGKIAKVREACLELPFYGGKNVQHARDLLESSKLDTEIPETLKELAWACQVGSFTDRERTPEMLQRVKDYAEKHPESKFLRNFLEPLREYQATQIQPYFRANEPFKAIDFFEKTRKTLYPKVSDDLAKQLFAAYADTSNPKGASEFWESYQKEPETDLKVLRSATIAAEMHDIDQKSKTWAKRNKEFSKTLLDRNWKLKQHDLIHNYLTRMRNSTTIPMHNPWLLQLYDHWAATDPHLICDAEYPILSGFYESGGKYRKIAEERVRILVEREFPAIFKKDESCGISLLEFEAKIDRQRSGELGKRYLSRTTWPLSEAYRHMFWALSEQVYQEGNIDLAKKMWAYLAEKAPEKSEESRFSKARLDPTTTEFERLWK